MKSKNFFFQQSALNSRRWAWLDVNECIREVIKKRRTLSGGIVRGAKREICKGMNDVNCKGVTPHDVNSKERTEIEQNNYKAHDRRCE